MNSSSTNTSRRRFLKNAIFTVSATAIGPNLIFPALADPIAQIDLDAYKPIYFSGDEWTFLLAAVDKLIPADEHGPSALETNVPIFIDRQMQGRFGQAKDWYMEPPFAPNAAPEFGYQSPLTPAQTYRLGIKATDAYCQKTFEKNFAALDVNQQIEVLTNMQKGHIKFDDVSSTQFFSFLLQNTKEGYFADPIHGGNKNMESWKMIGFPGARASFKKWVDYPNVAYPLGPVSIEGQRG